MRQVVKNFRWAFTGEPQEMLVENGRVVERGFSLGSVAAAAEVDLRGAYLMPAFIDAHCHILPTGLDLQKLHLGGCQTKGDILDLVRQREDQLDAGEWLMAVHYDQTKFSDGSHLTRHDLDRVSAVRPILLRHVNGHASIANSAALHAAGIDRNTPDPPGGEFGRDADGSPNGVLLENAHERVTAAAKSPTLDQMVDAILQAGDKMHALGISCASDMMTGRYDLDLELQAYRIAAERGCKVRTRLYLQWSTVFGKRAIDTARLEVLSSAMDSLTCRVAGIKIFADGAIGSATAAIYGRFMGSPEDRTIDGQLMYEPEKLRAMVRTAHDAGYRISIHSIGDRSTDLVMDAYAEVGDARRHRIEHAMVLSDAQIERMHSLGIHCAMQPEFLHWFGHAYMRQLGPERASKLKRIRSVMDAGIPVSFNSDRPIVGGDPWDGILTAEKRPDGFDLKENVSRLEGLVAYTHMGAVANDEPELMGSLDPGQVADYQIYKVDPMTAARPISNSTHTSSQT